MAVQVRQDLLIDYILKQFEESEQQYYDTLLFLLNNPNLSGLKSIPLIEKKDFSLILHIMEHDYSLIEDHHCGILTLTKEGRKIIRNGGWSKYVQSTNSKSKIKFKRVVGFIFSILKYVASYV
jgi:predicted choloylglycine hydrolase